MNQDKLNIHEAADDFAKTFFKNESEMGEGLNLQKKKKTATSFFDFDLDDLATIIRDYEDSVHTQTLDSIDGIRIIDDDTLDVETINDYDREKSNWVNDHGRIYHLSDIVAELGDLIPSSLSEGLNLAKKIDIYPRYASLMYRDGANYKQFFWVKIPDELLGRLKTNEEEDTEHTIDEFNITPDEMYDALGIDYDDTIDHNLVNIVDLANKPPIGETVIEPNLNEGLNLQKKERDEYIIYDAETSESITNVDRDILDKLIDEDWVHNDGKHWVTFQTWDELSRIIEGFKDLNEGLNLPKKIVPEEDKWYPIYYQLYNMDFDEEGLEEVCLHYGVDIVKNSMGIMLRVTLAKLAKYFQLHPKEYQEFISMDEKNYVDQIVNEELANLYDEKKEIKLTNKDLESEMDEGTSIASVGAGGHGSGFAYIDPYGKGYHKQKNWGTWAKNEESMFHNQKPWWPEGSFVTVKKKCQKFPYCNQGDTGALNFSNPKASRYHNMSEGLNLNNNEDIYIKTKTMGTAHKLKEYEEKLFQNLLKESIFGTENDMDDEAALARDLHSASTGEAPLDEIEPETIENPSGNRTVDNPVNVPTINQDAHSIALAMTSPKAKLPMYPTETDVFDRLCDLGYCGKDAGALFDEVMSELVNMGYDINLSEGKVKKEKWIQKATKDIEEKGTEGKCTPITKPGCTGKAKTLAKTFKKIAKKKETNEGLNLPKANIQKKPTNVEDTKALQCPNCGSNDIEDNTCSHCGTKFELDDKSGLTYRDVNTGDRLKTQLFNDFMGTRSSGPNESIAENVMKLLETGTPGITMYDKIHGESGTSNKAGVKRSMDNAKRLNTVADKTENEKLSGIGNGEPKFANFDKDKTEYNADYTGILRGMGLQDIQYDTEPSEDYKKRAEEAITGSAAMGNDPNYANAQRDFDGTKGELGKKIVDTAKAKKDAFEKTGKQDHTAIRYKYPPKTHEKTHIAVEGKETDKQPINEIKTEGKMQNLKTKKIIHYEKDLDNLIPESHKVEGATFKLFDGKKTVYELKWEGNALVIESEKNKTLVESERNLFKKMSGYSVGQYKVKPKGYLITEDEKNKVKLNENVDMSMSFFTLKQFPEDPIVLTKYGGISMNGDVSHFGEIINILTNDKITDNNYLVNLFDYKNKITEGQSVDIKYIKFESHGYNKLDEIDQKFIEELNTKLGIVPDSGKYSPHGMTPYWEVELVTPITLHF